MVNLKVGDRVKYARRNCPVIYGIIDSFTTDGRRALVLYNFRHCTRVSLVFLTLAPITPGMKVSFMRMGVRVHGIAHSRSGNNWMVAGCNPQVIIEDSELRIEE